MTKQELKDKITTIAQRVLSDKLTKTDDILQTQDVEVEEETYPLLMQFPTLKTVVIKLLTKQYKDFIKDIWWVAPRPTTFRIILANDQVFYIIYTDRSWIAKIEGKKYYLLNLSEEQNAIEAIARILSYGAKASPEKEPAPSESSAPESPAPESPAETPVEAPAETPAETPV